MPEIAKEPSGGEGVRPEIAQATVPESLVRFRRAVRPVVALTAYNYPFGRLLDEAGVDLILVGDSAGMAEHGRPDTTTVTLEEMALHTRSVRAGVKRALLVADLPFGTYRSVAVAVESARVLVNAGADAVKLEGGREIREQVMALRQEGFYVVGHLGMLPQRIKEEGRYRVKGRAEEEAQRLLEDALALDEAGAEAIVLELVHPPVAAAITQAVRCPTIGIGSGPECAGQILVTYDLIGLTPWFVPGFVKQEAAVAEQIQGAVARFIARVRHSPETGITSYRKP